ncbi:14342_t:CDS:2 [Acaulospora morrowiae]|uniref:14342_t:CDS:1 n=1 Tax=Acaulospora morrowiae TaxID=94023 RepID=A0A9N9CY37_9GLOM|nr:14342_t:CDS:2 [Acaulospora morrowiae]
MGGQLTKEQARLPFGYVSVKSDRRHRISGLNQSTIRTNVHSSPDNSDSLFNELFELNTHLQSVSNSLTLATSTGETSSINTAVTDGISPETAMEIDNKPEDETPWNYPHDHDDNGSCCQGMIGIPEEFNPNSNLNKIMFSELPSLKNIGLCQYGLVKLSPNICFLFVTTCLQICCNELTEIPAEIGYMKNLQTLDVSKNRLECIPDTIGFLHKLSELKLSENQLTSIPSSIGSLKKLSILFLDNNKITELPPEIGQIKTLVNLDVRENPITVLPAELGRLQYLRKLRTDGCPLTTEFVHQLTHSPPTLMELAARTIVRLQVPILEDTTDHIKDYLASAKKCSFCGGPYFENYVKRGKIIDKNDHHIPLEYRLCCPHWNTEQERVSLLFCALPDTAPSPEPYKHQRHQVANEKPYDGNASVVSVSSSTHEKVQRRPSTRRSMTIPLSSLTRSPSLPSLPRSASPRPTTDLQDDVEIKKTNTRGRTTGVTSLWRSRKSNLASAVLGKPARNNSASRLSSRWRI